MGQFRGACAGVEAQKQIIITRLHRPEIDFAILNHESCLR